MKPFVRAFSDDVFYAHVTLVISDADYHVKLLKRRFNYICSECGAGICTHLWHGNKQQYIIWMPQWEDDAFDHATLAHECSHAAAHNLRRVGAWSGFKDVPAEEIHGYLMAHYVRQCLKALAKYHG